MPRTLSHPLLLTLLVACAWPVAGRAAEDFGVQVRAACYQQEGEGLRVLADLSCETAMDCWVDPDDMYVMDAASGEDAGWTINGLVFVDDAGKVLDEPPMQGTIRAIWDLGASRPGRVQLAHDGEPMTPGFEPAADCKALPAAAVARLLGR